ncbi:MAG: hypothetical protein F6K35_17370 [Okeania sp. SIO2H7]|nr:hypothetical protein [Okeania sp. SIO2H7]
MDLTILPLKIVIFQILILLVAIATEAAIFKFQLKLPPKTAVEYAAFINLLSACAGWTVFLSILNFLPDYFLDRVMLYIIFGSRIGITLLDVIVFAIIFISSLTLKLIGMQLGDFFWYRKPAKDFLKIQLHVEDLTNRQSAIGFAAHLCSHFLIVLIWLIQAQKL